MSRSLMVSAALLAACGSSPDEKDTGPDACKLAQAELTARLGPEFDRVVGGRRLALKPAPGGCALIFLQKDEELAGEVAEEGGAFGVVDQLLAIAMPDSSGKLVLNTLGASAMAPGPVLLTLDGADVDGDGTAELVVSEAAGDYQGLRVFLFPEGATEPVEVFAERLQVKTPEGIDIAARWSAGQADGAKAIILDGAGTKRIFTWSKGEKKFTFNEGATRAAQPKVETPVAPVPEAPVSAAPEEKKEEKKVEKAAKKVKGKKGIEKKEEKPTGPVTLPDLGL